MRVHLEPVTPENVRTVCDLAVTPEQAAFVERNAVSLAEAYADGGACRRPPFGSSAESRVATAERPDSCALRGSEGLSAGRRR
jgi:hypothetical protein